MVAYLGVHVDNNVVAPVRHGGELIWEVVIGSWEVYTSAFPEREAPHLATPLSIAPTFTYLKIYFFN